MEIEIVEPVEGNPTLEHEARERLALLADSSVDFTGINRVSDVTGEPRYYELATLAPRTSSKTNRGSADVVRATKDILARLQPKPSTKCIRKMNFPPGVLTRHIVAQKRNKYAAPRFAAFGCYARYDEHTKTAVYLFDCDTVSQLYARHTFDKDDSDLLRYFVTPVAKFTTDAALSNENIYFVANNMLESYAPKRQDESLCDKTRLELIGDIERNCCITSNAIVRLNL